MSDIISNRDFFFLTVHHTFIFNCGNPESRNAHAATGCILKGDSNTFFQKPPTFQVTYQEISPRQALTQDQDLDAPPSME